MNLFDPLYNNQLRSLVRLPEGPGPEAQLHEGVDQHGDIIRQPWRVREVSSMI